MKHLHFLRQQEAFLAPEYRQQWLGPLWRGNHPLPHQSQMLCRDLDEETISRMEPGEAIRGCSLSVPAAADYMARAHCLPYRVFIHSNGGSAWTAFMLPSQAQAWVMAYGLEGVIPDGSGNPDGIESFTLYVPPTRKVLPVLARLDTGTRNRLDWTDYSHLNAQPQPA